MNWKIVTKRLLNQNPVFNIEEVHLTDQRAQPIAFPYYRIATRDWVNICAVTTDNHFILVEQPRVGAMQMTFEVPGGGIDEMEDPEHAAMRELEEETGYHSSEIVSLGTISPNPAIMTNKLHMYLARNCSLREVRQHFPDASEQISIHKKSIPEIKHMLRTGKIHNALSALTIYSAIHSGLVPIQ